MFHNLFQRHLIVNLVIFVILGSLLSACVPTEQLPQDIAKNQPRLQSQVDITEVPAYPGPTVPVDPYVGPQPTAIMATPTLFVATPILPTPEVVNPGPTPTSKIPRPTAFIPTDVPPTAEPPTAIPPTAVPPTAVPPTAVPPTAVPPTAVPPTAVPPTAVPPIATNTPILPTDTSLPPVATATPDLILTLTRFLPTATYEAPTSRPSTPTPVTPTWTPPTATPIKPTWTPPTATPIKPTWTPPTTTPAVIPPTATIIPVYPTDVPVYPTAVPVYPTDVPVYPTAVPVYPTDVPVYPTAVPVYPTDVPVYPTAVPVYPTDIPVYPTDVPVYPTAVPVYPTAVPPVIVPTQPVNTAQHIVQRGETLAIISDYYRVPIQDVANYNNIRNLNSIYAGQLLYIPLQAGAFVPPPPTAVVPTAAPLPSQVPTEVVVTRSPTTPNAPATFIPTEPDAESTPSSIVIPPIPIGRDQLVTLPHPIELPDVKFGFYTIIDGNLVYWSAATNQLTTIVPVQPVIGGLGWMPFGGLLGAGPLIYGSVAVIDYDVSDDGSKVLVKRGLQSADQIAYELLLLDMVKGTQTVLVESAPNLLDIDLSADGEWATYIRSDIALASTVLAVPTNDPTKKGLIGSCSIEENGGLPCFGLFKGKDNNSILYTDSQGVWVAPFDGGEQKRLVENGKGGGENPRYYEPVSWSADHRYLLLKGTFADGTAFYVYDLETDQFELVPYTSSAAVTSATWLPRGRLLVVEPSNPSESVYPMLTVLQLQTNKATLFEEENRLSVPTVGSYAPLENESPNLMATAPSVWEANGGLFGLYSNELQERGIYRLDLDALTVQKINLWPTLPPEFEITELLWSPDGQGLLVAFESPEKDRHVFYVSISADTPLELPFQTVDDSSMMWQP